MIALYGIPSPRKTHAPSSISSSAATPPKLVAAETIERGLTIDAKLLALTPPVRDAILGVLEDPPEGLAELRGRLARDHRDRQAGNG